MLYHFQPKIEQKAILLTVTLLPGVTERMGFGPFHKYIRHKHIKTNIQKGTQSQWGKWGRESRQKPGGGVKAASLRALLSLRDYKRGMGPEPGISPAHISSDGGKGENTSHMNIIDGVVTTLVVPVRATSCALAI